MGRSRRLGARWDEGEAGESDKDCTAVLPRCQCIGEKRSAVVGVVESEYLCHGQGRYVRW